jgi:outer membrane protein assembly factor BamA
MTIKTTLMPKSACVLFSATLLVVLMALGCSPVRRLNEGEFLLQKNKIIGNNSSISDAQLLAYVKQKPNRKVINLFRFHLQVYSLVKQERFQKRYQVRIEKRALKNARRLAQGKKALAAEPLSFPNWLLSIGESPVIHDTFQVNRSAVQLQLFLRNHGYFNALVEDSVDYNLKRKRAEVFYKINAEKPYTFNQIEYNITDQTLKEIFLNNWSNSLLRKGDIFNSDILENERDRITNLLRNEGYYSFVKNYIKYSADTTIGERKINLELEIENPNKIVPGFVDSTIESRHIRYKINNIFITSTTTATSSDLSPYCCDISTINKIFFKQIIWFIHIICMR